MPLLSPGTNAIKPDSPGKAPVAASTRKPGMVSTPAARTDIANHACRNRLESTLTVLIYPKEPILTRHPSVTRDERGFLRGTFPNAGPGDGDPPCRALALRPRRAQPVAGCGEGAVRLAVVGGRVRSLAGPLVTELRVRVVSNSGPARCRTGATGTLRLSDASGLVRADTIRLVVRGCALFLRSPVASTVVIR